MVNIISGFADAGPIWAVNCMNKPDENVMDCREPMSMVNQESDSTVGHEVVSKMVCRFGLQ